MSVAAYKKKIQVSADSGTTWLDLPATSPTLEIGGDILDDTNLATNTGYRTRLYGLHDWSGNADSIFKPTSGDAVADAASGALGLKTLRDAKLNRTVLRMRYLPTGAADETGLVGDIVVETYGMTGEVGGLETVSVAFSAGGALAPVV